MIAATAEESMAPQIDLTPYKTIWCRMEESGGYVLIRSRPAHTADRIVKEFNEMASPGRKYYAFPDGFNAKILGRNPFAFVVLQAYEDHLNYREDYKYLRIKEQVVQLALLDRGMKLEEIRAIAQEIESALIRAARGK
jgi:hypothetical protein